MMDRSVAHGTFTVEHRYAATPGRVFRAWSDADELCKWSAPERGWAFDLRAFDFRIGGGDVQAFGPVGEEPYVATSRIDDIIADSRIVSVYSVAKGETRISSSVVCVEFIPDGSGTLLWLTEQGTYLDGQDNAMGRKAGVTAQFEHLAIGWHGNSG